MHGNYSRYRMESAGHAAYQALGDAASAEIRRLKEELARATELACRMQAEAEEARERMEELEAKLAKATKA